MATKKVLINSAATLAAPIFALGLLSVSSRKLDAQGPPPPVGGPIQGLTQQEINRFNQGRNEFLQNENQQTGLGPVFNGVSCVQCHSAGAPGGATAAVPVSIVTRIGAIVSGNYSDLENMGGALLQVRSLREVIPNFPVFPEVIPAGAQFVSRRQTTPVFGMGLMEAIPSETILSRSGVNQGDGIMGVANMVLNPESGQMEVGRFGWKSQVSTIHLFAGDAYRNEMGITNPTFPTEVLPQGNPLPPGADPIADPEDPNGVSVNELTDFMRFIAPPVPLPPTVGSQAGQIVFDQIRCGACHVPAMTTGQAPSPALSFRPVNLYSDLLLHDMGDGLADGVRQGQASGSQWRTAPLWGLRFRTFYLHDGRSRSIDEAIRLHGGEASKVVERYRQLSRTQRNQLLEFLSRL